MNEFLQHFRFISPWWLLLLLAALLGLFLRRGRGADATLTFSTLSVLVSLGKKMRQGPGAASLPLLFFSLIFAILAMARPVWRKEFQNRSASGIDIMIAFDVSLSMEIDDFTTNEGAPLQRLDAAKAVVTNFVRNRPDDRIGLVVFSGQPYHISPITLDHDWLLSGLARVKLNHRNGYGDGTVREQGTAIGSAISAASSRLHARDAKSKIVVLITDGANNSGKISPIDAAKYAADLNIKIYAVALGTKEGRVSSNIQRFPRQEFDLPTLQEVSRLTGGEHYWAQTNAELKNTFRTIDELEKTERKTYTVTEDTELFAAFLIPSLIFAALSALLMALNPPPRLT
ncbi:MAG: VWA domain-containing protein [Akkermansiaceae bacterium]